MPAPNKDLQNSFQAQTEEQIEPGNRNEAFNSKVDYPEVYTIMGYQEIAVPTHWKVLETLERDTRMGYQAISVPAHSKALGTLEWKTKQYMLLHT